MDNLILFTDPLYANTHHLRTFADLEAALATGKAIDFDLGLVVHFSVVPAATYEVGTPVP